MNIELIASYKHHRALANQKRVDVAAGHRHWQWPSPIAGLNAIACLLAAREDVKAGKRRYGIESRSVGACFNSHGSQCRYFSDYAAFGFRLVGESHDVAPRAVEHGGWYTRADDYDEMLTGAVFLLPGRDGHAQVYAGYIEKGMGEDGGAIICIDREDAIDARGGELENSDYRDAAVSADHMAELSAEEQRDYDRAYQAGAMYARNREEIQTHNKEAREAARAYRETIAPASGLRDIVESAIRQARAEVSRKLDENEELKDGNYSGLCFYGSAEMHAAFNYGAEENVLLA